MKRSRFAAASCCVLFALACSPEATPAAAISAAVLVDAINRGEAPLILDVRSEREYRTGHVPGAMHVPHTAISVQLDAIREAAREAGGDGEIVVYCERGGRARAAMAALEEAGLAATPLEGHMRGWLRQGYSTE
jgi:rhodanese-related sulfurtransferase